MDTSPDHLYSAHAACVVKNVVQCRDVLPTKGSRDVILLSLVALPVTSISIFLCPNCSLCKQGMKTLHVQY